MADGLSLFLNITAGDLASEKIRSVVSGIRKMGDVSKEASTKLKELEGNAKAFSSVALATGGLAMKILPGVKASASLDRELTRVRQTAGFAKDETEQLRKTMFRIAELRGTDMGDLVGGVDVLSSKNMNFKETEQTIKAINEAMAVTKSAAAPLASGLTVAAQAWDIDLSKPGMALNILEQMTVAGRKGGLEIEDMADKLPVFAANAKAAGFSFTKTVALAEAFSKYQPNKDKLGTMVDSTLRLWTNGNYRKEAEKASGVKFFDEQGSKRTVDAVMKDMQAKYKKMKTAQQQADFIQGVFGKADLDTINGWRNILSGDVVPLMRDIESSMARAGGTFANDMNDAMDNAIDQSNRLKNSMQGAVDSFSRPLNKTFANAIDSAMILRDKLFKDPDTAGGKAIGASLGIGGAASLFFGVKALMNLKQLRGLQGVAGNAAGMTVGAAAARAAGVQPVFIAGCAPGVFADSGIGGGGLNISSGKKGAKVGGELAEEVIEQAAKKKGLLAGARGLLAKGAGAIPLLGGTLTTGVGALAATGAAGVATIAGGAVAAGAVGYGLGTMLNNAIDSTNWGSKMSDKISEALADVMDPFFGGNRKAYREMMAKEAEAKAAEVKLDVQVHNSFDADKNLTSQKIVTKQRASHHAKDQ